MVAPIKMWLVDKREYLKDEKIFAICKMKPPNVLIMLPSSKNEAVIRKNVPIYINTRIIGEKIAVDKRDNKEIFLNEK